MKVERILRLMCLLVAFLMLDAEGILRLTEGKTFHKVSISPFLWDLIVLHSAAGRVCSETA